MIWQFFKTSQRPLGKLEPSFWFVHITLQSVSSIVYFFCGFVSMNKVITACCSHVVTMFPLCDESLNFIYSGLSHCLVNPKILIAICKVKFECRGIQTVSAHYVMSLEMHKASL